MKKKKLVVCEEKGCPFSKSRCLISKDVVCPLFGEFDGRDQKIRKKKKKERRKIKKIKAIDPHVHCRDEEESYKTTIKEVCRLAKKQGVLVVFDMPNTARPIICRERVKERLELAKNRNVAVAYYLYVGLTENPEQVVEAVAVAKTEPKVCGLKLYAGPSVGNLGITDERRQKEIYYILAQHGYTGVLAVHCEKESLFKSKWNPKKPWTWGWVRPPESEIESVRDQIKFACEAGFKGNLHICHITCHESVKLVVEAKEHLRITCGVTPHHLLYTDKEMRRPLGLFYKANPPLRDEERVEKLRQYLREGKIDWIETDHAPHTQEEKFGPPYCSGIPSLRCYRTFLSWLNKELGISWQEIEKLTYWNILKTFKIKF